MTLFEEKKEMRKKIRSKIREFFEKNDVLRVSAKICGELISSSEYKNADAILCFLSSSMEIETKEIVVRSFLDKKILAIPRVIGEGEMEFRALCAQKTLEEQIKSGAFGIKEPTENCSLFSPFDFAGKILVVTPGVAFTKNGERLGHGKGFYDRFFSRLKKSNVVYESVGLCFPCQIVDFLPTDQNDEIVKKVFF